MLFANVCDPVRSPALTQILAERGPERVTEVIPEETEDHDVEMLSAAHELLGRGQVEEGLHELFPALQTRKLQAADGWAGFVRRCLRHPLRQQLHQDPLTQRAFAKPRGYAGDAVMLDLIYGREEGWPAPEGTTALGRSILDFTSNAPASEAVRARRGFIADHIDQLANEMPHPQVLSVAAGHLREALLCAAIKRRKLGRYVALDADRESLQEVTRCHGAHGVEPVQGSVRQMLAGKLNLGQFDFVYSMGLFDYLPAAAAKRLTSSLFKMLRPRGRLLIANFLPGIPDLGYMESFMEWKLIYRNRQEMLELSADIPEADIREIRLFAEDQQNIIFLQIMKR